MEETTKKEESVIWITCDRPVKRAYLVSIYAEIRELKRRINDLYDLMDRDITTKAASERYEVLDDTVVEYATRKGNKVIGVRIFSDIPEVEKKAIGDKLVRALEKRNYKIKKRCTTVSKQCIKTE